MNHGYIILQRRFFSHWMWEENRSFSKAEAFLDLLQLASFVTTKRIVSGVLIDLDEGEIVASVRYLGARWTWGKDKVAGFMRLLEQDGIIRRETRQGETVIFLCNYNKYRPSANGPPDSKPDSEPTVTRQWPDKYKEREEGKKGEYTPPPPASQNEDQLCTIEQARSFAPTVNLTQDEADTWWHSRQANGWMKGTSGGGHPIKIKSWQSDMSAGVNWIKELAAKNKPKQTSWKPSL